jgi:transposase
VYGTLADWRKQRGRNSNNAKESANNPDDEIARLRKENSELHKANSILKDALGFFVEDRKR